MLLHFVALVTGFVAFTATAGNLIDHDQVKPLAEAATPLEIAFRPLLIVGASSCQPYAAVDAEGYISGGLNPSAGPSSGCRAEDRSQLYTRTLPIYISGMRVYAITYAWFFVRNPPFHPAFEPM